ncbi:unnamed protein product [Spirodela intermedia]|uniref:Uncharacterized protein n=2 Tax=Spirodela intermedia TaxID=51605 RepID=A0A7I8K6L5_SPIIN|nr:unnamed protein product [Spirodela intermedia]CAA6656611.1 unnamed protein product [Spirodela intermedia]CAA7392300.1 unnamed protein product [Spirodela intermedia]
MQWEEGEEEEGKSPGRAQRRQALLDSAGHSVEEEGI